MLVFSHVLKIIWDWWRSCLQPVQTAADSPIQVADEDKDNRKPQRNWTELNK